MAIRQKPSGAWEVYYRHPVTGKRKSETCPTQKEAVQKDALIKYRIRFERESFEVDEEPQPPKEAMTFEDALWLFLRAKNYEKASLKDQLYRFNCWIEAFKNCRIQDITKEKLVGMKLQLLSKGLKGTSIRRKFTIIKSLLRWCHREGLIESVPLFPEMPKDDTKHFVPPTRAEIMLMLQHALPHIQRIIVIGFSFGPRIGPCELFRLEWSDVDLERKILRMPSSRKNIFEPWRELPIRDDLIPILRTWKEQDAQMAVQPDTVIHYLGKRVHTIRKAWMSALQSAGLRHMRPYDLRHAFATEALAAGVDIGTTARIMGHRSPVMILEHYQHVMDAQKKQAVEAIPCVSDSVCLKKLSATELM